MTQNAKSKNKRIILIAAAVLAIALLSLVTYRIWQHYDNSAKTLQKPKAKPMPISYILPTKKTYSRTLQFFGNLEPLTQVDIYPKAESRIIRLYKEIGDHVRNGQLLAQLDDVELIEQKKQKEAQLRVIESTLQQDQIKLQSKRVLYEQSKDAYHQQIIPRIEFDNAKTDYDVAKTQVALTQAKIAEGQAAIEEINVALNELKIYAPMDGVIVDRYLDQGAMAKPGQAMFKIMQLNELKLLIKVAEQDLPGLIDKNGRIKTGLKVEIYNEIIKRNVDGVVYKIYPVVDMKTRTATVEIRLSNNQHLLKPGYYCRVLLNLGESEQPLFIPTNALNWDEIQSVETVQTIDCNKVKISEVKTTHYSRDEAIVLSGIVEDTKVITPFNPQLKDGSALDPKLMKLKQKDKK